MKLKNVLKGIIKQYGIEELHILSNSEVIYTGDVNKYLAPHPSMLDYKKDIDNQEVKNKLIYHQKAFIFI